jgi:hypothetical protein
MVMASAASRAVDFWPRLCRNDEALSVATARKSMQRRAPGCTPLQPERRQARINADVRLSKAGRVP